MTKKTNVSFVALQDSLLLTRIWITEIKLSTPDKTQEVLAEAMSAQKKETITHIGIPRSGKILLSWLKMKPDVIFIKEKVSTWNQKVTFVLICYCPIFTLFVLQA